MFGDDYYSGRRETINLSGFVQLNKWPMPGFEHRVDEKGHAEFDPELISAPEVGIKGYSYELDDRIQILSNPLLPNTGHVRQIVPGKNFPAEFYIRRFGILETSTLRLVHRNVIDIYGVVDGIPPYKKPLTSGYSARRAATGRWTWCRHPMWCAGRPARGVVPGQRRQPPDRHHAHGVLRRQPGGLHVDAGRSVDDRPDLHRGHAGP